MVEHVSDGQIAAHAVAENGERAVGIRLFDVATKRHEVAHELVVRLHERALAARLAVPAVVDRMHGVPGVDERGGDVPVSSGMLAEAVDQHHRAARLTIGPPGLVEEVEAVERSEGALGVVHASTLRRPRPDRRVWAPPSPWEGASQSQASIAANRSSYSSTAGNCENSCRTRSGERKRIPASAALSIDVSL